MGNTLPWHRRHAVMLAGQLPENYADAVMVVKAITELLETFLAENLDGSGTLASNVLPFATG